VALIGLSVALQWPLTLYSGGLMGLEDQVRLNLVAAVAATVRVAGALIVLAVVSPTIQAFLIWQAIAGGLHTLAAAILLRKRIPRAHGKCGFAPRLLKRLSASWVLLSQIDKLVLSRLLSLEDFGYYSVAGAAANALFHLVIPVQTTFFPRLARLARKPDRSELISTYELASEVMAVSILPAAAVVAAFSRPILLLWTGNVQVADEASLALSLLVAGNALMAVMNVPYSLHLAAGSARPVFVLNVLACLVVVPLAVLLASRYGPSGGAAAWALASIVYLTAGAYVLHRGLLPDAHWRWLTSVILPPLAAVLLVGGFGAWIATMQLSRLETVAGMGLARAGALLAVILTARQLRGRMLDFFQGRL
jgi:O-antigen/teichoic acid export membrane protein